MTRATRRLLPLAAVAAALVVGVPQAAAGTVDVRVSDISFRPQRLQSLSVPCPRGSFALAGGVRSMPPGSFKVAGSIPQDDTTWAFTLDSRAGAQTSPVTVSVWLACATPPPVPRGYAGGFNPETPRLNVHLGANQTADAKLGCPTGYRPTGYGVQATGGTQPAIASVGVVSEVTVVRAKPVGSNVELTLANTALEKDLTVAAQCIPRTPAATIKRRRKGRRSTVAWRYRAVLQSSPETLSAGDNNDRRRRCTRHRRGKRRVRSKAVSTWTELGSGTTASVFTSFPVGRDGVWNIYSAQAGQATLHLLCMSASSRWR